MSYEIRACTSVAEAREAVRPRWHYFGRSAPADELTDRAVLVTPPDRFFAAWEDGRAVGGAGAWAFDLTVPGGRIPAAGVTAVGVLPTHRRQGILRAMMRAQLDDCRRRGDAVAYLWATEDAIYGHCGYGIASVSGEIEVAREHAAYVAPLGAKSRARLLPLADAEAVVAPIWERVARVTPG